MTVAELVKRTAVVVLNWNGIRDTSDCIASLAQLTTQPGKVIVVDNASQDGSENALRTGFPWVQVVQAGRNLGYAGGNNLGIRTALDGGADLVWILNNDTIVSPSALEHLIERVVADSTIAVCGSTLVHADQPRKVQALAGASYNRWLGVATPIGAGLDLSALPPVQEVERQLDYVVGASTLVTRRFVESAGLMDEGYFLFFEELDWIARLPDGMRLGWARDSVVHHKDGATIGRNRGSADPMPQRLRYEYFMVRSRLRYAWRHVPISLPSLLLVTLATVIGRLLRGHVTRAWILLRALVAVATGIGVPRSASDLIRSVQA